MIGWAWVNGRLPIDLDLMLAKRQGDLYAPWGVDTPEDVARVADCAATLGWSANWTRQVSITGLARVALHAGGKSLQDLTDDDITACTEEGRGRRHRVTHDPRSSQGVQQDLGAGRVAA